MQSERSIRRMTAEETQAKRNWGTAACQVRGCSVPAVYLVRERRIDDQAEPGEWWQYCCQKHARSFASRHHLSMPEPPAGPHAPA